ncbi:hypothetical protein D3C81_1855670 [compost metagenome]
MDFLLELMKLGEILGLGTAAAEKLGREMLETDITDATALKKIYAEEAIKLMGVKESGARKGNRRAANKHTKSVETDALFIVKQGLQKEIAAAQSLKDAGLTATFDEFV